jgi:hypothetical protein
MPVSRSRHGSPGGSARRSAPSAYSSQKPRSPLIAASSAVKPSRASSAAVTPERPASPACSGFVIVPKLRFTPAGIDAAMASVRAVSSAERSSSEAAVAAAPKVPNVDVGCQPAS